LVLFEGWTESGLRFAAFASVFLALAASEFVWPRRKLTAVKSRRWATNLAIVGIDGAVVRALGLLAVPIAATAAAAYAGVHGIGVFNWVALPVWLETVLAIVALDFAIWLQHVATHKIPILWRLHKMHHSDVDIDVTTAIRFHPIEIALSVVWKVICVLVLGPSVLAVVLFEIILNAGAMFSHANIRLPAAMDAALRTLIVTPDMHRVHHSVLRREHDTNFGFNLSVWDRLFGTYCAEPEKGQEDMTIGLSAYQTDDPNRLGWSLFLPFAKEPRAAEGGRNSD
jgi:sterol desaturase/sphingolipid hydroxylase (fatty acid hydroxylase superfamily)